MKTIPLPRTGLTVSQLCLGTNQFGTALDEPRAHEMLDTFRALGGNFIDTAHGYADWIPSAPRAASEHCIGRWLARQRRDSVVIATKGCEFDYRAGFTPRVTPEHLRTDLEGSLAALGTDYIDLYWLHRDDPSHPVEAILDALIAHQRAGRIRHFGCSNWSVSRIQLAQRYAASIGHEGFVACQPMWGLAEPDRAAMQQFAPGGYYEDGYRALHEAGLTMIPYSGQSRGIFASVLTAFIDQDPHINGVFDRADTARIVMVPEEDPSFVAWAFLFFAIGIVATVSSIMLTIKRLHDMNVPATLIICLFIPAISFIALFAFMVWPGTPGPNDYGSLPDRRRD